MSQVVKVKTVKHSGAPVYLGDHVDADGVVTELYSRTPGEVVQWLCDGHRFWANLHRGQRSKSVWVTDPMDASKRTRLFYSDGAPVLVPRGMHYVDGEPVNHEYRDIPAVKDARQQWSWLAAMPDMALHHASRSENTEWSAAAKRCTTLRSKGRPAGSMPGFRKRGRGDRFGIYHNHGKNAVKHKTGRRSAAITVTGANPVGHRQHGVRWKLVFHVRVSQPILPYTSMQYDKDTNTICLTSPPAPKGLPRTGRVGGIDMGVAVPVMTSDGVCYTAPDTSRRDEKATAHQRAASRYKDRHPDTYKASPTYRELQRLVRVNKTAAAATRTDHARATARALFSTYDIIVAEDLNITGMVKRPNPKPDPDHPCGFLPNGAAAKTGLTRGIIASVWGKTLSCLEQIAVSDAKLFIRVPAAYTSQMCHACKKTHPDSRKSQAEFACVFCGHQTNADHNAANNLNWLGQQALASLDWDTVCGQDMPTVVSDLLAAGHRLPMAGTWRPSGVSARPSPLNHQTTA